jgi:adenylate cyclase
MSTRQLAAVLFTDVAGYTAMMQEDEAYAISTVRHFREVLESSVNDYNGKIIQFYGDGCLLLFSSSVDAVKFAKNLQLEFVKPPAVPARIGIHMGDVLMNEGNIFGDAVNIAARLQALASPGEVYFSEVVQHTIANKKEFNTRFVREESLKNVREPVRVFELINEQQPSHSRIPISKPNMQRRPERWSKHRRFMLPILAVLVLITAFYFIYQQSGERGAALEKSIAVLPFVDMSKSKDQEYFGDGLAEQIINSLTTVNELRVIGRTSSFQFKGQNLDLREIGKKLNAGLVLEGSVQQEGGRVRVTAQLIRVSDHSHIWSEQYDRELTDIFRIQDDIALKITDRLKITLSNTQKDQLVENETDPQTYNLYLKGLHAYRENKFESSIDFLTQAISSDSSFALPYAYISLAKAWIIYRKNDVKNAAAIQEAKNFALNAIRLSPTLEEGYSAMGLISWRIERDFPAAQYYFDKSIERNTKAPLINSRYAYFLVWMYELELAKKLAKNAMESDPIDYNSYIILATILRLEGDTVESNRLTKDAVLLFPNNKPVSRMKINNAMHRQQYDSVIKYCEEVFEKEQTKDEVLLALQSIAYFNSGRKREADLLLNELKQMPEQTFTNINYSVAHVFANRKQWDSCFNRLDRSLELLEPNLNLLKTDILFKEIRGHQRYKRIYEQYGFGRYKPH